MTSESPGRSEPQKERPALRRRHRQARPVPEGQLTLDLDV